MTAVPAKPGVYRLLWEATGHFYIGASRNMNARKGTHSRAMRTGAHGNKMIQQLFAEYGLPRFQVVELCELDDLAEREYVHLNAVYGQEMCVNASKRLPAHIRRLRTSDDPSAYNRAKDALPEYLAQRRAKRQSDRMGAGKVRLIDLARRGSSKSDPESLLDEAAAK